MAAAAGGSIQQSIVEAQADIREAKEQLQGAVGDERVALQQRLAALEQQKLLLMQSGATGWPHRQCAGLQVANPRIRDTDFWRHLHFVTMLHQNRSAR